MWCFGNFFSILFHMKGIEKQYNIKKTTTLKSKIRPFSNCDVINCFWLHDHVHDHFPFKAFIKSCWV